MNSFIQAGADDSEETGGDGEVEGAHISGINELVK